ncbi:MULTISPECIES: type III secretion protein [unclassified Pseudomonas]|uniref:type III secretion protein n=1 Tax=unclassified Pseudomonas TaxID=196821 RepID=UPI000A1E0825|nr:MULTISPECIES: type III secretion protein [unclassified Pseudomonas]
MSHSDSDNLSPAGDALLPTLDLLAPIRRHRLAMAEQAWRRQRDVLAALQTRLTQMADELQRLRRSQQQERQEQREQHSHRRLPLHEMNRWLAGEQQAIRRIERFEQHYKALQQEHRQQQHWTDDSRQQLRRRQRDLEKLDCLRDLSREAS